MHAGRVEEAASIARRVRGIITKHNSLWLNNYDTRQNVRETWSKVSEVTRGRRRDGRGRRRAYRRRDALNRHYATISTDPAYVPAKRKQTAAGSDDYFTEYSVFHMLDRLKPTAMGLDGMPAWFLRLMAPIVAAPLAALFNQSILAGVAPRQWKDAVIIPVPKVPRPVEESDYRPLSITSVLSRQVERHIVRRYIYPAFVTPPPDLCFADQYAFRQSGSATAALVAIHSLYHIYYAVQQSVCASFRIGLFQSI